MNILSVVDILHPTDAHVPVKETSIHELCIDSRQVARSTETLFFAIRTDKNDGHKYIPELIQQGTNSFVVTEREVFEKYRFSQTLNMILVDDAVKALQDIATAHRRRFTYPVIGITGSNGKTIVKEWLASALNEDYRVVKSPDSFNSQIGVPLSVWRMSDQHNLGIFEAGISKPEEMALLARIIHPTIGILTNIGMAHAQFFQDKNQKTREKLKLFKDADILIYHDDNEKLNSILQHTEYQHLKKISWGSEQAYFPITNRHTDGTHTLLTLDHFEYAIPFLDAASVENATHIIVTLRFLGIAPNRINQRIARLSRINMRTEILEGLNHSVLINDTYSLDKNSLNAALDFLDTQHQLTSKTLILSDFEQVGPLQETDYKVLNDRLQAHHISKFIAIGPQLLQHQHLFTVPTQFFYADTETMLEHTADLSFSYETILVKGARNFHFEKIVRLLQHKTHLTTLHVSLPALAHNLRYHRSLLQPDTKLVAMVKAHSYGLGDVELVNELLYQGTDYLAVAYTDEGVRLRKRHIQTPIIVLGAEAHSFDVMVQHQLEPEIFNFYYLHELEKVLERAPQISTFNIHLKLDTGMHRLGFDLQDIPELIRIIKGNPRLRIRSVFSHLAAAEDPSEDEYTLHQIRLFQTMTDQLCSAFDYKILRHILNSAGIFRFREHQFDMVRLGISLYGCSEIPEAAAALQNVATLKTVITQVKHLPAGETIGYNRSFRLEQDTQVAIIPIGYADGYPRELGNGKGKVIIQGHKVPIIGKVCMDMCMLDVSGLAVHEGDEVIVYGEGNTVSDMAKEAGLISYELLTRISQRVPRIYVRE